MIHNPKMRNVLLKCAGFTLVELITVMIIVGVLAVAVMPRFFEVGVFQERGTIDQVKAALRYGQKVAIAQRRTVNVNISQAASSDCGAVLSAGNVNCVVLNSITVSPLGTFTFNALGQRTSATGAITVGGTTITIEAETGYVH